MEKKLPPPLNQLTQAFAEIPFNKMLGLKLDHLASDHIAMSFRMKPELIGNFLKGILHGGVISSVLDMAGGMAVMTTLLAKHSDAKPDELAAHIGKTSTIDLQVSYLRPGKGNFFTAKAWIIKIGNKIAFTRMKLHNEKESLIATASGTYLV